MLWYHYVAFFFGGLFGTNAVPHMVAALMGEPFQSPFAKPPGVGLSSSTVNALWGSLNLVVAYLLLCQVGSFDLRDPSHGAVVLVAVSVRSVLAARHFGRFHGGNDPSAS